MKGIFVKFEAEIQVFPNSKEKIWIWKEVSNYLRKSRNFAKLRSGIISQVNLKHYDVLESVTLEPTATAKMWPKLVDYAAEFRH